MAATPDPPGPADDAHVAQEPGAAEGLDTSRPAGGGHEREVGVAAAVERGPAELSHEGGDVAEDGPEHPDAGEEPAHSTDETPDEQ